MSPSTHTLPPFIRSPYNYDRDAVSKATGLKCQDKSLTQQQFKDETDINVIVERFGVTGLLPQAMHMPSYDDFTQVVDYHTAMNAMRAAEDSFNALPANIRERFRNDPQLLVEFCSDDANIAEARTLGLLPEIPARPINLPPLPNPPTPA